MKLSAAEARARFVHSPVAVLGTADAAGVPHLVPVTYLVTGDLVFVAIDGKPKRSRDLRRLRNIAANPRVCLLAQHYDADWSRLWWARADGAARIVDRAEVPVNVLVGLAERYPWYRENPPTGAVIEVTVDADGWSGWGVR
jgi:PPOX class probable F420-dependent enzyme